MRYVFGDHLLDVDRRELMRGNGIVRIEPQVFDLLVYLLENRARVVSRSELIERIWQGRVVSEATIDSRIRAVRLAIGDSGTTQHSIRSFVRKGVRFIAAVEDAPAPSLELSSEKRPAHSVALLGKPVIAVRPLRAFGPEPDRDCLVESLEQDIIVALSCHSSLSVLFDHRQSIAADRDGGDGAYPRPGARYALGGGLRLSPDRVQVGVWLADAHDGRYLWARRFSGSRAETFSFQDQIAAAVASSVSMVISGEEQRRALRSTCADGDAWVAYQRGLWHLEKGSAHDNTIAGKFFHDALKYDASFAAACTGLAWARINAGGAFLTDNLGECQREAELLARRAIALDPADAEARAGLAGALVLAGDMSAGLEVARSALEMGPTLSSAHGELGAALMLSGRTEDGIAALRTSVSLDPRSSWSVRRLTWIVIGLYLGGDYEAAIDQARRVVRVYPTFPPLLRWFTAALGQLGHVDMAARTLNEAVAINPSLFEMYVSRRLPWFRLNDHAHMLDGLHKAGLKR